MTEIESLPKHLISLKDLSFHQIDQLLKLSQTFVDDQFLRSQEHPDLAICTLFFEPSTRTRLSFQRAAQKLQLDVLNFDVSSSSTSKGETAVDTVRTIESMQVRGLIIRHSQSGVLEQLAHVVQPSTCIINAGDGVNAHPTQGLLDMLTIRQAKGDVANLKIVIVGDIRHSRVARSDIHALRILGAKNIWLCGPQGLLSDDDVFSDCIVTHDMDAAIENADVVMMLRLQKERMQEGLVSSVEDYHRNYGLSSLRLKKARHDAVVLHPGPINRGIEIDDDVADGSQSMVLQQVRNGVAVRMAVLKAWMNL